MLSSKYYPVSAGNRAIKEAVNYGPKAAVRNARRKANREIFKNDKKQICRHRSRGEKINTFYSNFALMGLKLTSNWLAKEKKAFENEHDIFLSLF